MHYLAIFYNFQYTNQSHQMMHQKTTRMMGMKMFTKRVTNGGAHLRDLTPGQHSSEETSQWWLAIGDTVPI